MINLRFKKRTMNETLKNILKIVGYIILAITGGAAGGAATMA
jgi:hypothetical protein